MKLVAGGLGLAGGFQQMPILDGDICPLTN